MHVHIYRYAQMNLYTAIIITRASDSIHTHYIMYRLCATTKLSLLVSTWSNSYSTYVHKHIMHYYNKIIISILHVFTEVRLLQKRTIYLRMHTACTSVRVSSISSSIANYILGITLKCKCIACTCQH